MKTLKLSYNEYDRLPGLRSTHIKAGATSMKKMHHVVTQGSSKMSRSQRVGRNMHACLLEPDLVNNFHIWDGGRKYGKKWDEWIEDGSDPDWTITEGELSELMVACGAMHSIPLVESLLKDTEKESVITWETEEYGEAKARFDAFLNDDRGPIIIEYKTTNAIEPTAFERRAYRLGYHLQFAWQTLGVLEITGGTIPECYVIVQEQTPPYDGYVEKVPEAILDFYRYQCRDIAIDYRKCEAKKTYPGIMVDVIEYTLPSYSDSPLKHGGWEL